MKKVFLENWYRLTVNVSSPDACLLKEDLCLPVVPLASPSDSLADSWDVVVTMRLLSFFHMPHHLAQSSLHLSPVSERSQKVAPSEDLPPKLAFRRDLALLLEVGDQLAGLRSFAQHNPEVLGSNDTLLCLGSFPGSKKGEKDRVQSTHPGFGDGAPWWPPTLCHPAWPAEGQLSHVRTGFRKRGLPAVPSSNRLCQSQSSWDRWLL